MAKAPTFPFYASDFLTDTNSWDAVEVGIYIRLLSTQWVNGFIVDDHERLARISGVSIEVFKKAWVIVGLKFGLANDNQLKNEKLEDVRTRRDTYLEKQSTNGKKGGRPPKNNPDKAEDNPTLSFGLTQNISQKKPLENEHEKEIEKEIENKERGAGENNFQGDEFFRTKFLIPAMLSDWLKVQPNYPMDVEKDTMALGDILRFIQKQENIDQNVSADSEPGQVVLSSWSAITRHVTDHSFFCRYSLRQVAANIQSIIQDIRAAPKLKGPGKEQHTVSEVEAAKETLRKQYANG